MSYIRIELLHRIRLLLFRLRSLKYPVLNSSELDEHSWIKMSPHHQEVLRTLAAMLEKQGGFSPYLF